MQLDPLVPAISVWCIMDRRDTDPIFTEEFQTTLDEVTGKARSFATHTLSYASTFVDKLADAASTLPTGLGCDNPRAFVSSKNPLIEIESKAVQRDHEMALIYVAAATGVLGNQVEITEATRAFMDHDQAFLQYFLSNFFGSSQEISAWIDRDPASAISGGWAHRLAHGHDLAAMVNLWNEHGHVGGLEWVNHVWLRDFWTPHGVPYLPAGSGSVYDWLIGQGVTPSTALGLLSINAAEAATGVLALLSLRRVASGVQRMIRLRKFDTMIHDIIDLCSKKCHPQALELADRVMLLGIADKSPSLALQFATTCLDLSRTASDASCAHAWGAHAFMAAASLVRAGGDVPKTVLYHGDTAVSFAGLAATVMVSAYASQLRVAHIPETNVFNAAKFASQKCIDLADEQRRPNWFQVGSKNVWAYRPLSALSNLQLALEMSTLCGSLSQRGHDPIAIRSMMVEITRSMLETPDDDFAPLAARIEDNLSYAYPYGNVSS